MGLWELALGAAALLLPVATYLGEPVALLDLWGTASQYHPWSSLAVAGLAYGGLWVMSWR
jgi:hypothetical protein